MRREIEQEREKKEDSNQDMIVKRKRDHKRGEKRVNARERNG